MEAGSWWPDGDVGAGRIPLAALEHADYCLHQAALIHVDGLFLDDARTVSGTLAHRNVHKLKYPLPRSDVGAQLVTGVPARITTPIRAATTTCRRRQRRDFGPGEDHNDYIYPLPQNREHQQKPGSCPSRDTPISHSRRRVVDRGTRRISCSTRLARANGGSGVVTGVVETSWTEGAARDGVRRRGPLCSAHAGLHGRAEPS